MVFGQSGDSPKRCQRVGMSQFPVLLYGVAGQIPAAEARAISDRGCLLPSRFPHFVPCLLWNPIRRPLCLLSGRQVHRSFSGVREIRALTGMSLPTGRIPACPLLLDL